LAKWKKISILREMEEDLNLIANGRPPQFGGNWKTISIFVKWKTMED
jgi:hypothetical protein